MKKAAFLGAIFFSSWANAATALSPTGATANNRIKGAMEVLKLLHEGMPNDPCAQKVEQFLLNSPGFLDNYVVETSTDGEKLK